MNPKDLEIGGYYIMEGMDAADTKETTIVRFDSAGRIPILGSKIAFFFSNGCIGSRMLLEESIEIGVSPIPDCDEDYMKAWVNLFFEKEAE